MTQIEFKKLVNIVSASKNPPPLSIFADGVEDWHSRCRLAQFLSLPSVPGHEEDAIELFKSIEPADVDMEDSEDVEEKISGLQRLAELLRTKKNTKRLSTSLTERSNWLRALTFSISLSFGGSCGLTAGTFSLT